MVGQVLGTLSGVAVGGALAFLATYANERAKWTRSHAVRWDERRLAAYVEYSNCVRLMQVLANRIAVSRNLPGDGEPLSVDEGIPLLAAAEAARSQRWQEVLLLGGPRAIEVGYELNRCSWTLEWFARGKLTGGDDWRLASAEAYRLRRRFVAEARKDLGVPDPDRQMPAWIEDWTPEILLSSLRQAATEGA
ncbi:hypothetical protein [Nocardia sp. NPDC049526]|uniref:hypothetical protein n=1 Tax=Nocardia sp. NPDC049526 TaxID=3364316 RepID=UPI003791DCAE